MSLFEHPDYDRHERVVFIRDPRAGLRAILAIHRLGQFGASGGGCRMWPYPDSGAALRDVLRLSRAMTWKLALADLPAGGAKTVVIGDPATDKSDALFQALGRAIQDLGGRYIVAEDVGTTPADMEVIAGVTPFVLGRVGDTGPATGHGVLCGLRVAAERIFGRASLDGLSVAIQGLGGVGWRLARELRAEGVVVIAADVDAKRAEAAAAELGLRVVEPAAILEQSVDILAPCALGDVLDDQTIPRLRCHLVVGGANNQLRDPDRHADALAARGIVYVPDFALNAGGVLAASLESPALGGGKAEFDQAAAFEAAARVGPIIARVLDRAEADGVTPHAAAVRLAREALGEEDG